MNKSQSEAIKYRDKSEQEVIDRLKAEYKAASKEVASVISGLQSDIEDLQDQLMFASDSDEIEVIQSMIRSKIYQQEYQERIQKQIDITLGNLKAKQYNTINDFLHDSYNNGYIGAMYDIANQGIPVISPIDPEDVVKAITNNTKLSKPLYESLGYDIEDLKDRVRSEISRGIASGYSYSDIAKLIDRQCTIGYNRSVRIARTESHRIAEEGADKARHEAKAKGADIVKQWDSALDKKRTRKSHKKVDGEIKDLDELFSNGLRYPGDENGSAEEVINCRCVALQRAKWALDEEELEELRKRAEFYGIDKNDSFEEYKKKYLGLPEDAGTAKVDPPVTLKEKIEDIKSKATRGSDGSYPEEDIKKAGKAVMDDIDPKLAEFDKKISSAKIEMQNAEKAYNEYLSKINPISDSFDPFQALMNGVDAEEDPEEERLLELFKNSKAEYRKLEQKRFEFVSSIVKESVSSIRDIGIGDKSYSDILKGRSPMKKYLEGALDIYPTDWINQMISDVASHGHFSAKSVDRGYFDKWNRIIAISNGKSDFSSLGTAIHEFGHFTEDCVIGIRSAEKAFYDRRTSGCELEWFGYPYPRTEKTRKDNFLYSYMGKDYGDSFYELCSMGFQLAYQDYGYIKQDEDYCSFILGLLAIN